MDVPFHKRTNYTPIPKENGVGDGPEAAHSGPAEKSVAERAASGARAAAATPEASQPDAWSESLDWLDTSLLDMFCLQAIRGLAARNRWPLYSDSSVGGSLLGNFLLVGGGLI